MEKLVLQVGEMDYKEDKNILQKIISAFNKEYEEYDWAILDFDGISTKDSFNVEELRDMIFTTPYGIVMNKQDLLSFCDKIEQLYCIIILVSKSIKSYPLHLLKDKNNFQSPELFFRNCDSSSSIEIYIELFDSGLLEIYTKDSIATTKICKLFNKPNI